MTAPKPPQSLHELEFKPRPMVCWFSPMELIKAGVKSVVSSVFGKYADKRELDAALKKIEPHDYSAEFANSEDGLWIDYVADLGDGWDATYTIARLLAEEKLTVDGHKTQRGRILIMGGDQVYPTAKLEEYNDRLVEPYRCALPYVEDEDRVPHLYAIPGNHDWYDGLSNFRNLFMTNKWIGAWKTQQKRSYFAIKFAPDRWLWGIDIQLNSNIDQSQFEFFEGLASDPKKMQPGSHIILCTAEPSWVLYETLDKKYYDNFNYLERKLILPYQHHITVGLAGDLHNYTRYQQDDNFTQRFVSGGGGAYLFSSHNMPKTLELPTANTLRKYRSSDTKDRYQQKKSFPLRKDSRLLSVKSLLFPFKNMNFSLFMGGFYLFVTWLLQSNSVKKNITDSSAATYLDAIREMNYSSIARYFFELISFSPPIIFLLGLLVIGLILFVDSKNTVMKIAVGGIHGLVHIVVLLVLTEVLVSVHNYWHPLLFGIEMLVLGGIVAGLLFGFYFFISNLVFGLHSNEVLLCQSSPHYKHFLRLHLTRDKLTIYPIGVKKVPTPMFNPFSSSAEAILGGWALQSQAKTGEAWFEPRGGKPIDGYAELVEEKPIVMDLNKKKVEQ